MNATAVEVLTRGRDKIRDRGWFRNNPDGRVDYAPVNPDKRTDCFCIGTSVGHDSDVAPYIFAALGLPWDPAGDRWMPVWNANDAQPVDKGQAWAVGFMDKAIELAKEATQ